MWWLWCNAELGQFDEAAPMLVEAQEIITNAENHFSPLELSIAGLACGLFWLRRGLVDPTCLELAIETLNPALDIARHHKLMPWIPAIASPLGSALTLIGKPELALPLLEEAVKQTSSRQGVGNALRLCHLARAHLALNDLAQAETLCEQAVDLARRCGEAGHEAYALETLGRIAFAAGAKDRSKNLLEKAGARAEDLGMLPLRTACSNALREIDQ
jgi:tetratricopeptide (TPR) repeat protein